MFSSSRLSELHRETGETQSSTGTRTGKPNQKVRSQGRKQNECNENSPPLDSYNARKQRYEQSGNSLDHCRPYRFACAVFERLRLRRSKQWFLGRCHPRLVDRFKEGRLTMGRN
jgi:hypothetical protein